MNTVHLVASIRVLVNQTLISEAVKPTDLSESDLTFFIINSKAEWRVFQFIVDHSHLPVITTLNDNFDHAGPLFDTAREVFPNGAPKNYSQLSWEQKKFLTLVGAETTAVCLDVIPVLYGKVPKASNDQLPNVKQIKEYHTLAYANAATKTFNPNELIVIHDFRAYYKDVALCFPKLHLKGVYLPYPPKTGSKKIDDYLANITKKEWEQRGTVNCHELNSQLISTAQDREFNFLRFSVKAHFVPSWTWTFFSKESLDKIQDETNNESDFSETMLEFIRISLHEQLQHLKQIILYKNLPIISALNIHNIEEYQQWLYKKARKVFPEGLPEDLDQLSWEQKRFLLSYGAEKVAVFTNIIPRLYGIPQLITDTNFNNQNQIADFKTLYIAEKIANELKVKNIIVLYQSRSYYDDVAQCFPYFVINKIPRSIEGENVDKYTRILTEEVWGQRPPVNCTALNNALTPGDRGTDFHIMVNEPVPTPAYLVASVTLGLAIVYGLVYSGLSLFRSCTRNRNTQKKETYQTYKSNSKPRAPASSGTPASASKLDQELLDKMAFPNLHSQIMRDLEKCSHKIQEVNHALSILENNALLKYKKGKKDKDKLFPDFSNTITECKSKVETLSTAIPKLTEYSAANFTTLNEARSTLNALQEELTTLSKRIQSTKQYYQLGKNSLLAQNNNAAHSAAIPERTIRQRRLG